MPECDLWVVKTPLASLKKIQPTRVVLGGAKYGSFFWQLRRSPFQRSSPIPVVWNANFSSLWCLSWNFVSDWTKKTCRTNLFLGQTWQNTQKIETFFDQNLDVLNFCAKAKFFSQNPALVGRRPNTQEYSVKFSCQNLQPFSLRPLNQWYHCVKFSIVTTEKCIRGGAGLTPLSSSSTTVWVSNTYLTGLLSFLDNVLWDGLENTCQITYYPEKL